jgi:hypothetical protein
MALYLACQIWQQRCGEFFCVQRSVFFVREFTYFH